MNFPARLLQQAGFVLAVSIGLMAHAADQSATQNPNGAAAIRSDAPLVITNGTFVRAGQTMPATIRNLIDLISHRYTNANITIVGVDNVVINDLTLQWRMLPAPTDDQPLRRVDPPLHAVIAALAAASGGKLAFSSFSPNDVLINAPEDRRDVRQTAEVFNLAHILSGSKSDFGLDRAIRDTETELAVLSNRYGSENPRIKGLNDQLEVMKAQRAKMETRSPSDDAKRLDQIREVITLTLQRLKPGATAPDFEFHAGTNLLVVIGNEDAIDIARKVIAAFEKNPN